MKLPRGSQPHWTTIIGMVLGFVMSVGFGAHVAPTTPSSAIGYSYDTATSQRVDALASAPVDTSHGQPSGAGLYWPREPTAGVRGLGSAGMVAFVGSQTTPVLADDVRFSLMA